MEASKDMSKSQKIEYIIVFSLLALSVIAGIIVGMNEEWFLRRNFTAGYMAGSLLTVLLLFGMYQTVNFFLNMKNNSKKKS